MLAWYNVQQMYQTISGKINRRSKKNPHDNKEIENRKKKEKRERRKTENENKKGGARGCQQG